MRISDWSSDVCSSDLLITIGNKIATGQIDAGIGGGSDTTSDVPIVYGQKLRRRLLEAARGKTTRDRLAAFKGFHFRELKPEFPGVAEPRTGKSMGDHCEDMAKEWNSSEEQTSERQTLMSSSYAVFCLKK